MMFADTKNSLDDESGSDWDDLKVPSAADPSSKRTFHGLQPLPPAHAHQPEPPKPSQGKRRFRQHKQYGAKIEQERNLSTFGQDGLHSREETVLNGRRHYGDQPPFDFRGNVTPIAHVTHKAKPGKPVKNPDADEGKLSETQERGIESVVVQDVDRKMSAAGSRDVMVMSTEEREDERKDNMLSHLVERPSTVSSVRMLEKLSIEEERREEPEEETQLGKQDYERHFPLLYYQEDLSNCYSSRDNSDAVMMSVADKSEHYIRRLWQEVFGFLRLLVDFVIVFFIELLRFLLQTFFHRCVAAMANLLSNHIVRPVLSATHNVIIQPLAVLLFMIGRAVGHVINPVLDILNKIVYILAVPLKAFRLVEINWKKEATEHV
ncbi:uncharacterized protein LOC134188985 isoform X2 [Corticium candelabrum]|uniref:uncharacterized protein LOC134188985 isoform X2 n=1 Tax=Corticium candelabrum TaxID=121492 RepID=UPI002E252AD7|nr:uncharacterized protein LOC134188985 isoform X2 [Corticium candelabrum]